MHTISMIRPPFFIRFVNIRFTVEDGASLIFEMGLVVFGPNTGVSRGGGLQFATASGAPLSPAREEGGAVGATVRDLRMLLR